MSVSAVLLDLDGDGGQEILALRVRAEGTEWYVLPASTPLPEIPPCLE